MKRARVMSVLMVGAVVSIAACSSSSKSSTSTTTTTVLGVSTSSSPTTAALSPTSVSTSTTRGSAAGAALAVATNAKLGTKIIVAASGKTVYMYVPDGSTTTSKVPAAIKAVWPAVTVSGAATVGAGLDQSKLVLEPQPDGTKQVAYNGHLLYTFQGDAAPGSAAGERLGGFWFVLSSAGAKIA
jgi:predicted lipoprotein with Yx(FWY)xxD motif